MRELSEVLGRPVIEVILSTSLAHELIHSIWEATLLSKRFAFSGMSEADFTSEMHGEKCETNSTSC